MGLGGNQSSLTPLIPIDLTIGEECGLARLDDYVYMPSDQIAEFLRESGATDDEIERASPVIWYPAVKGRDIMQGYITALNNYHSISETTKCKVIPELESFLEIFSILVDEGNEWHFEYDI